MPESAEKENDERVADDLGLCTSASAQGNVNVISEPGGEGDVPASPELGDVPAEIRNVEVSHQLDSEEFGRTDGDIRVSGEIPVNLEGEQHGRQQKSAPALVLPGGEHLVDNDGAVVGDDHFLEKTPKNLSQSVHPVPVIERPGLSELRQKVSCPFDRTRDKLRKETHKSEELDDIPRRRHLSTIDVNAVREGLEGIKTDADGKDDPQEQPVRLSSEKQVGERCGKEIIVLENPQDKQVQENVHDADGPRFFRRFPEAVDEQAGSIAAERSECNQEQEPPIPPSVEDVGDNHNEEIPQFQIPVEYEPVEQKDNRQENGEFYGIEQHLMQVSLKSVFRQIRARRHGTPMHILSPPAQPQDK